jgi:biopolymer transport protein ExbD
MEPIELSAGTVAKRPGFGHRSKINLRIDMTPMVDLGFLLISFFVITTQLGEPKYMDLYMPADGQAQPLGESGALTVLLEKDNTIYYYHGDWETAKKNEAIYKTNYAGEKNIRRIIEEKQKALDANKGFKEGRTG